MEGDSPYATVVALMKTLNQLKGNYYQGNYYMCYHCSYRSRRKNTSQLKKSNLLFICMLTHVKIQRNINVAQHYSHNWSKFNGYYSEMTF